MENEKKKTNWNLPRELQQPAGQHHVLQAAPGRQWGAAGLRHLTDSHQKDWHVSARDQSPRGREGIFIQYDIILLYIVYPFTVMVWSQVGNVFFKKNETVEGGKDYDLRIRKGSYYLHNEHFREAFNYANKRWIYFKETFKS